MASPLLWEGRVMLLRKAPWLVLAMMLAVGLVAGLAYWDGENELAAAREEFAEEQVALAQGLANFLSHHAARGTPGEVLMGLERMERPGAVVLLLQPPGRDDFVQTSGRKVHASTLDTALESGRPSVWLSRPEAASLGLPERVAVAGLARSGISATGRWGVAVVASAAHERDREQRGRWRTMLAVTIAGGLVLVFGSLALRNQRHELQLSHELAIAELARQRDERLERVSQAATMLTLASGMAHELSTPLGVIVGRAEQLASRVSSDERAARSVRAIQEQAERIREVVRGFLGLARGGAPTLRDVDPEVVVSGALALVEHRLAEAGVSISTKVAESLPRVRGEPRLLEHALVNLLLNACDACPRFGIIKVLVNSIGPMIEFAVVDNGTGIAQEDIARVSEPFFTTKPTGTGLGLAVTSEIVKTHRGALSIRSEPAGGTRAAFTVPIASEDSHAVA